MRSAQLAHKAHTKSEPSTSFRLGYGEVTTEKGIQAAARRAFFQVASETYPDLVTGLQSSIDCMTNRPMVAGLAMRPEEDWKVFEDWARAWNLVYRGQVPDWVLEVAYETLVVWLRHGYWEWFCTFGGGIPERPVTGELLGAADFDPLISTLKEVKGRIPRSRHPLLSNIVRYYVDNGLKPTPKRSNPEFFRWAVRNQVGRETYSEIAKSEVPAADEEGLYKLADAIKKEVVPIKRLIGLSSPAGRPPAR